MSDSVRLTTAAACRVSGIDRVRFNEHVGSGAFSCAPETTKGRARLFNFNQLVALRLFREFMDDGMTAKSAGRMACAYAVACESFPDAPALAYVQYYIGSPDVVTPAMLPAPEEYSTKGFNGRDIRKVQIHAIGKTRELIAHYIEEERNIIGEDD